MIQLPVPEPTEGRKELVFQRVTSYKKHILTGALPTPRHNLSTITLRQVGLQLVQNVLPLP